MNPNPKRDDKPWKSGKKWIPPPSQVQKDKFGVEPHNVRARRDLENIYPPTPYFMQYTKESSLVHVRR